VKENFRASIITIDGAEFSAPSALTLRLPRKRGTKIYLQIMKACAGMEIELHSLLNWY